MSAVGDCVHVVAFPIAPTLDSGISVHDYAKFLDSSSGASMVKEHGKVVRLTKDSTAYFPSGWLAQPVYLSLSSKDAPWRHVWSLTLFNKEIYEDLGKASLTSMENFNRGYLAQEAVKLSSFKKRAEAFNALFGSLAD